MPVSLCTELFFPPCTAYITALQVERGDPDSVDSTLVCSCRDNGLPRLQFKRALRQLTCNCDSFAFIKVSWLSDSGLTLTLNSLPSGVNQRQCSVCRDVTRSESAPHKWRDVRTRTAWDVGETSLRPARALGKSSPASTSVARSTLLRRSVFPSRRRSGSRSRAHR